MANPKVATIVPLNHLDEIQGDDYFMALSHAASNRAYLDWFAQRSAEGKYVILDDSAVELGKPEPFEAYFSKAAYIGVSEIMLPDVFQNSEETLTLSLNAMKQIEHFDLDVDIMAVPHGRDTVEWLSCAVKLAKMVKSYGVEPTIGISCRYTSMWGGSRLPAVLLLLRAWRARLKTKPKIHLLGCYSDPRLEVYPIVECDMFIGVDSSYPSVYAQNGYELLPESLSLPRPVRNIDFIKDSYDPALLRKNMEVWQNACRKGWSS